MTFASKHGIASELIAQQHSEQGWAVGVGPFATVIYNGEIGQLRAKAQELIAAGGYIREIRITPAEGRSFHRLHATYSGESSGGLGVGLTDAAIQTTWSSHSIRLNKDIWEHPLIQIELAKIGAKPYQSRETIEGGTLEMIHWKILLRNMVDGIVQGRYKIPNPEYVELSPDDVKAGKTPVSKDIYVSIPAVKALVIGLGMSWNPFFMLINELSHGHNAFPYVTTALVKTSQVPRGASIHIPISYVNRVFTTSAFIRTAGVPLVYQNEIISVSYWLKDDVQTQEAPDGSITTTETYIAQSESEVSTFLYDNVIT